MGDGGGGDEQKGGYGRGTYSSHPIGTCNDKNVCKLSSFWSKSL